jgi:glycosyltransferase involved in cell wall biosynthesis
MFRRHNDPDLVILLGPLPAPTAGTTVMFELLRDELVSRGVPHRVVDIADRRRWPWMPGLAGRLIDWAFIAARYVRVATRRRSTVYLVIAQSRRGFARDAFVITYGALMGHRIVLHVNCGDYGGFWKSQPRWLRNTMSRILRLAELIVVPSDRLVGMFDFEPELASRIEVLPNAARAAEPPVLHKRPPNGEIRLVYLSNFIAAKGYAEVVQAVKILRSQHRLPATCRLAGHFFAGDARKNLQKMIEQEGLEAFVTILPVADHARKYAMLRDSHFLLLPTRYHSEAQPLAIIEALATGCVPIAPEYRAIPDLIVHGHTGILAAPDPAEIAETIAELYRDPERYETMSRAAVAHHKKLFTAESHLETMLTLLKTA